MQVLVLYQRLVIQQFTGLLMIFKQLD